MDLTHSPELPLLRRRNFISTSAVVLPPKLNATIRRKGNYAPVYCTLELLPVKPAPHSYSSLLPPRPVNSPKPRAVWPGPDNRIRNRLLKQGVAWAHLRPMAIGNLFRRLWTRVAVFIGFLRRSGFVPWMGRVGLSGFGSRHCDGLKCVLRD